MVGPPPSCLIRILQEPHFSLPATHPATGLWHAESGFLLPLPSWLFLLQPGQFFCYLNAPSVHPSQPFLLVLEGSLTYLFPLPPSLSKLPLFFQISIQTSFLHGRPPGPPPYLPDHASSFVLCPQRTQFFSFQHVNSICIIHAKRHYLTSTSPTGMEPSWR